MTFIRILKLLFVLCLFIHQNANAHGQVGCKIGNYILTTPTGGIFMNGLNKSPIYNFSPGDANTINKRNWSEDPQCGILRTIADNYSIASGGSNNPNSDCSPANNNGDIGKLVYYNPADNNCTPTNVPLDNNTWVLLFVLSVAGFVILKNRMVLVN